MFKQWRVLPVSFPIVVGFFIASYYLEFSPESQLFIDNDRLKLNCKIYKGNFYSDSFNFFPITPDNHSFLGVFLWGEKSRYTNFFTEDFYTYFNKKKKDFKKFNDVTILGSSVSDNYYRNLITFLPRIFFISDKKINLAIHRKSSNKFRNFLKKFLFL